MHSSKKTQVWYKEPTVWLLLAPLMLVFVVCSVLLGFALSAPDDKIADDYYKQGKMINKRFAAEQQASDMGLWASVDVDHNTGEVFVQIHGDALHGQKIDLLFSHPAKARQDFHLPLAKTLPRHSVYPEQNPHSKSVNSYRGELSQAVSGRWYVQLKPRLPDESALMWRLKGKADFRESSVFRLE